MATYDELAQIQAEPGWAAFSNKVRVAAVIKAVELLNLPTPTAGQVGWAQATISNPSDGGDSVIWYAIGNASTATTAQIVGANDASIQSAIDVAVDVIIAGGA